MTSALIIFQNEWRPYEIADSELDGLITKNKIICGWDDTTVIYAISMADTNKLNVLCSNILQTEIYGSIMFVKMRQSQLVDLDQQDIDIILKRTVAVRESVDDLSNMIDNLEIIEDMKDSDEIDAVSDEYFDYFSRSGYDSN